jgi:hypothetical protein
MGMGSNILLLFRLWWVVKSWHLSNKNVAFWMKEECIVVQDEFWLV